MPDYKIRIVTEAVSKNKEELEKVKGNLDGVAGGGKSAGEGLLSLAKNALSSAAVLGALYQAGQMVVDYLKESVQAAAEAEMAEARRNAIFKATSAETRTSIELLDQYASTISAVTYVDDEMIVKQEELLLQFRSLSGTLIPATLEAAIDMAGGFQGDVLGSTESLGRALELVSQGGDGATMALSTLRRQSIILDTATQQNIISLAEQGKTAEAQTALLEALSDIVGGRATEAANTMQGAEARLNNALENQKEIVGGPLQQEWTKFLNFRAQGVEKSNKLYELTGQMTDVERKSLYMRAEAAGMDVLAYAEQTLAKEATTEASKDVVDDGIDPEIARTRELTSAKQILAAAMAGDLKQAYSEYGESMATAQEKTADLQAQLADLLAAGYEPTSEKVQEVTGQIREQVDTIAKSNAELKRSISLMILHNASAHLDARGQLALAQALGVMSKADYEAAVAIEDLTAKYDANGDGVVSAAEGAERYIKDLEQLRKKLLNIPSNIDTTVTIEYITTGTPPPGGGCFLAGTRVHMADHSQRPIESVRVGEYVLTYDFRLQENVPARVCEIFHHEPEETDRYLVINHDLRVTPNHRVYTSEGWKAAGDLRIGHEMVLWSGEPYIVEQIDVVDRRVAVFNLHVDHPDHNYYANEILVHNTKTDGEGAARGADFIVPPGFPNDTFPLRVESGERVIVIPKDEASAPASASAMPTGTSIYIGTLIVQGGGIAIEDMLQRINDAAGSV